MRYGKTTEQLNKLDVSSRRAYRKNPSLAKASNVEMEKTLTGVKIKSVGKVFCTQCRGMMAKNGFDINGKQKYRCAKCKITRIMEEDKEYFGEKELDLALTMLKKGFSLRDIGKQLKCSHTTVSRNIKQYYGECVEEMLEREQKVEKEKKSQLKSSAEEKSEPESSNKPMRWDEYM